MEMEEKRQRYASEIFRTDRNALVMRYPFMAKAFYLLKQKMDTTGEYGTDGEWYYTDPDVLIKDYLRNDVYTEGVFLHTVLHCLYLHPFFTDAHKDKRLWDLAADICINDICRGMGEISDTDSAGERVIEHLKKQTIFLSAQNIYRILTREILDDQVFGYPVEYLGEIFGKDDHSRWYTDGKESRDNGDGNGQKSSVMISEESGDDNPTDCPFGEGGIALRNRWEDIADHVEVALEIELKNQTKQRGEIAGDLLRTLKNIERDHIDYSVFLRKFAVPEERMRIDLDSFDYNYYSYGLELFGDMPLIEPLEFKEMHTITDFVIAVDTSGSCDEKMVRKFLTRTYDILSESNVFGEQMNVHIIQCDAVIQEVKVIHQHAEMDEYMANFNLRGGGGTDFRPVFQKVERLRKSGDLSHIRGLLYFTDGYGVFPQVPTDYKTAFIFVEQDEQVEVPAWAMRVMLEEEML